MKELKPRIHENGMDYVLVATTMCRLLSRSGTPTYWALGTLAPVLSEIAPSHALQRANFVRQAIPHRRCRSERAGGRQAGLDYPGQMMKAEADRKP